MEIEFEAKLLRTKIDSIAEDLSKLKEAEENQSENAKFASQTLRDSRTETGNRPSKADAEQGSKIARTAFTKDPRVQNSPLMQVYQDNKMTHHQKISLYNLIIKDYKTTTLVIYNTEIETNDEIIMQTSEVVAHHTCIAQLSNGKLFCYGNCCNSGITLIIDESGGVEVLPSGTPCFFSSAIYFNNSVYCFGGFDGESRLTLSSRFDLDRNEWIELAPLPKEDEWCNSIIFNGNILISGYFNINLVRYSMDSNSFTIIPYQFAEKKRKILINGERLFLIECNGSMYESEIGGETAWRQIAKSTITFDPWQTYCSYNKGEAYIGCNYDDGLYYFRFNFANIKIDKN